MQFSPVVQLTSRLLEGFYFLSYMKIDHFIKTALSKSPGIYIILSATNSNGYIGSTINLKSRKYDHFKNLRKGKHGNSHLQNHYNLYDKDDLWYGVLEIVKKYLNEDQELFRIRLFAREQYWVDLLNPEFNILKKIVNSHSGVKRSEKTKALIKENHADVSGSKNPMYGKNDQVQNLIKKNKQNKGKKYEEIHGIEKAKDIKNRLSIIRTGKSIKSHTKESKQKSSIFWTGKRKGKDNPNFEHYWTEEQKQGVRNTLANKPIQTCIWCGYQSNIVSVLKQFHFDNCKMNPNRIVTEEMLNKKEETNKSISNTLKNKPIETCPHCKKQSRSTSFRHYHFDNCKKNPEYIPKEDTRKEITCPHCGYHNKNKGNMIYYHFDNCKHKK
jgi:group I intron endonuclease